MILLTGHGSEEIATQALRAGAAGYVPKSTATKVLTETVHHVLDVARSDIDFAELWIAGGTEINLTVTSHRRRIKPLVSLVQKIVADKELLGATVGLQVTVAVEQALLNSLYHGNWQLKRVAHVGDDERPLAFR